MHSQTLEIILQYSVFEFNDTKYQQKVGNSMGTSPSYANNFMAKRIDTKVLKIAEKHHVSHIVLLNVLCHPVAHQHLT